MSIKDRLPDELADVRARLHAVQPAPCRIERDELMYRAGFAAAQARLSQRRWILPAITAAAVIAALAIRLREPTSNPVPAGGPISDATAAPVAVEATIDEMLHARATIPQARHPVFRFDISSAPLLAARERALQFEFDEPTHRSTADTTMTMHRAASVQQLRQELLFPRKSPATISGPFPWQWLKSWTRKKDMT